MKKLVTENHVKGLVQDWYKAHNGYHFAVVQNGMGVHGILDRNGCIPLTITPEMVAWAREHTPGIDHRAVTEAFVDYWRGVPGTKGVKLDWPATWRNWLRRERDDHRQPAADRPRPGASVWDKRLPEVGA